MQGTQYAPSVGSGVCTIVDFFVGQSPSERRNIRIRCKNIVEEEVNFALQFLSENGIYRGTISYVFGVKGLANS